MTVFSKVLGLFRTLDRDLEEGTTASSDGSGSPLGQKRKADDEGGQRIKARRRSWSSRALPESDEEGVDSDEEISRDTLEAEELRDSQLSDITPPDTIGRRRSFGGRGESDDDLAITPRTPSKSTPRPLAAGFLTPISGPSRMPTSADRTRKVVAAEAGPSKAKITRKPVKLVPPIATQRKASTITFDVWKKDPNAIAWQIYKQYQPEVPGVRNMDAGGSVEFDVSWMGDAQRTTRNSLKSEPYYAFEATEIRDGIWQVMDQMERFAMEEYSFDFPNNVTNLEKLTDAFRTMKPETVKIVALIASGGPGGSNGWRDLFFDSIKRQGLVCGIIGNVLEEQVFKHPFFGGKAEDIKALNELEEANIYGDAFDLHSKTAEHIHKAVYNKETARLMLPVGFDAHVKTIVAAILTHLDFITRLDPKYSSESVDPTDEKTKLYTPLYRLVAEAGILSLYMRMDTRTVYHFVPTFKDQTYDNAAMACFNEEEMKATDPHTRKTWPANYTEAEKRRAEFDEPLVQIRIFEGVTAYRKGSWETSSSTAKNQRFVKAGGEDDGVRSRILTCSWVYCRWGRRKEFKDRKDVSDPEAHGMQWDGGFVNFSDVMGVPEFEGKGKGQVT